MPEFLEAPLVTVGGGDESIDVVGVSARAGWREADICVDGGGVIEDEIAELYLASDFEGCARSASVLEEDNASPTAVDVGGDARALFWDVGRSISKGMGVEGISLGDRDSSKEL